MFDMFFDLLGMDPAQIHVSDDLIFVVIAFVVLFVVGEFFNIIRNILNFAFGKR